MECRHRVDTLQRHSRVWAGSVRSIDRRLQRGAVLNGKHLWLMLMIDGVWCAIETLWCVSLYSCDWLSITWVILSGSE